MNWLFEDNVNTDLITPGRYNITTDPDELAKITFIEHCPEFAKKVKKGDFVVGGSNFGCGSSRETAAIALRACNIEAVIAKSFARIFYRNCMNQGLLAIIVDTSDIDEKDKLKLDVANQKIINTTQKKEIPAEIPEIMIRLHQYGGIVPYLQKNGLDSIGELFG
jgi:3-isopropylmalate/(R)-2-methylmalate dehydratase small subunit